MCWAAAAVVVEMVMALVREWVFRGGFRDAVDAAGQRTVGDAAGSVAGRWALAGTTGRNRQRQTGRVLGSKRPKKVGVVYLEFYSRVVENDGGTGRELHWTNIARAKAAEGTGQLESLARGAGGSMMMRGE